MGRQRSSVQPHQGRRRRAAGSRGIPRPGSAAALTMTRHVPRQAGAPPGRPRRSRATEGRSGSLGGVKLGRDVAPLPGDEPPARARGAAGPARRARRGSPTARAVTTSQCAAVARAPARRPRRDARQLDRPRPVARRDGLEEADLLGDRVGERDPRRGERRGEGQAGEAAAAPDVEERRDAGRRRTSGRAARLSATWRRATAAGSVIEVRLMAAGPGQEEPDVAIDDGAGIRRKGQSQGLEAALELARVRGGQCRAGPPTSVGSGSRGRSRRASWEVTRRRRREPPPASSDPTRSRSPRSGVPRSVRGRVSPDPLRATLPDAGAVRCRTLEGRRGHVNGVIHDGGAICVPNGG